MNAKGLTLVELMVYIVLAAVIVALLSIPLKKVFNSSRSESRESELQSSARDAITIMSRELRNTGFKRHVMDASGSFNAAIIPGTFVSTDSSSFVLKQGDPSDTLTFYKGSLDASGYSTESADTITYYISDNTLKRKTGGTEIDLAKDVYALQFQTGLMTRDSLLFKADTFYTGHWLRSGDAALSIDGHDLSVNYTGSGNGAVVSVNTFGIPQACRLKIKFEMTDKSDVIKNVDSLRWSIINSADSVVASDNFKPGMTAGSITLAVGSPVSSARIQLNSVSHDAATLNIGLIEIRTIDIGDIIWSDTVTTKNKKNVKALKIFTLQRSGATADAYNRGPISIADITVNRNGEYAWRLLTETVTISNNGLF